MDTPVSKTVVKSRALPPNIFFRGLDYKGGKPSSSPTPARAQVVRARLDQVSDLRHLVARFQRTIQAVQDADHHGAAEDPAMLLAGMGREIQGKAEHLLQEIRDARTRYLPGDSPNAPDGGAFNGGPTIGVKPSDVRFPFSPAQAKAVQVGAMRRGRGGY